MGRLSQRRCQIARITFAARVQHELIACGVVHQDGHVVDCDPVTNILRGEKERHPSTLSFSDRFLLDGDCSIDRLVREHRRDALLGRVQNARNFISQTAQLSPPALVRRAKSFAHDQATSMLVFRHVADLSRRSETSECKYVLYPSSQLFPFGHDRTIDAKRTRTELR